MPRRERTGRNWRDTDLPAVAGNAAHRGQPQAEELTREHARATQPRYYCPGCGEAHQADALSILPHWKWTADWRDEKHCPGGNIDKDKDRAP